MTQKELYERNAELLMGIIPGVQAKDYKIESLNIFNIALFMVAKGFNEALGFDVLNYEEIFKISNDNDTIGKLRCEDTELFPGEFLENTEEVRDYCSRIMHYTVEQMYSKWIYDHIKLPNNQPVEAGLGAAVNFNNMNILENICCRSDLGINYLGRRIGFNKNIAEQLLNDRTEEIKGMWIAMVHMVYVAFANLVGFALSGQRITDWDYFWDLCAQQMLGASTQEQLDASVQKAFNPAQSQAPVDKNQPVELVGWSDIKPTSYVAPSEIEEVIIKKIMEEKMREVKISVG